MDTFFHAPEQRDASGLSLVGDRMTRALSSMDHSGVEAETPASAANDDQLDEMSLNAADTMATNFETTGSWDAYDVWRRFIKEARDRRKGAVRE
jgi:hypothetical protein